MAATTKTKTAKGGTSKNGDAPKRSREPKACACGCGGETRGGRYLPGHDARHKGQLLTALREGSAIERKRAEKQLRDAGWGHFIPE